MTAGLREDWLDRIKLFDVVCHKGSTIHPTCIVAAAQRQGNGALGHWQAMLGGGMAAQSPSHDAALREWEQMRPFPWLSCILPYRRAPEHDQLLFTEEITVGGASRQSQRRRDAQSAAWTPQRRDAASAGWTQARRDAQTERQAAWSQERRDRCAGVKPGMNPAEEAAARKVRRTNRGTVCVVPRLSLSVSSPLLIAIRPPFAADARCRAQFIRVSLLLLSGALFCGTTGARKKVRALGHVCAELEEKPVAQCSPASRPEEDHRRVGTSGDNRSESVVHWKEKAQGSN